ncbi:hypothetical protein ACLOJK_003941 [Asimina triloba]
MEEEWSGAKMVLSQGDRSLLSACLATTSSSNHRRKGLTTNLPFDANLFDPTTTVGSRRLNGSVTWSKKVKFGKR